MDLDLVIGGSLTVAVGLVAGTLTVWGHADRFRGPVSFVLTVTGLVTVLVGAWI